MSKPAEDPDLPVNIPRSPSGRVPKWVLDEAMGKTSPSPATSNPTPNVPAKPAKQKKSRNSGRLYGEPDPRDVTPERVYQTPASVRYTIVACIFGIPLFVAFLAALTP